MLQDADESSIEEGGGDETACGYKLVDESERAFNAGSRSDKHLIEHGQTDFYCKKQIEYSSSQPTGLA